MRQQRADALKLLRVGKACYRADGGKSTVSDKAFTPRGDLARRALIERFPSTINPESLFRWVAGLDQREHALAFFEVG
jgi:hypothetical protein